MPLAPSASSAAITEPVLPMSHTVVTPAAQQERMPADAALKNLQIADALRYFYWSQTLLRSHPDASNIKMTLESGSQVLLITWIPTQINQIFANLSVTVNKIEPKESYSNYCCSTGNFSDWRGR